VLQLNLPWLVAQRDGVLIGYAYAGLWRERHAYRFSVESSVYVAIDAGVRGVGSALYASLFDLLRLAGYHTVLGVIALPNAASVALHEKFGMRQVAHFKEVGFKFGRWHDVGNWQVQL
jgi:L-amino acid N-acyltransferase YncA